MGLERLHYQWGTQNQCVQHECQKKDSKHLGDRERQQVFLGFRISFSSRCGFLTYNRDDDKSDIVQIAAPSVTD